MLETRHLLQAHTILEKAYSPLLPNSCYHLRMTRPLRLEFEGALYHVTSRGDRREPIFENDENYFRVSQVHRVSYLRNAANLPFLLCLYSYLETFSRASSRLGGTAPVPRDQYSSHATYTSVVSLTPRSAGSQTLWQK
jgi:hypothetical protein